jgi:hypothetical protein
MTMIPWWWLLVALFGGGVLGALVVALCVAAARGAAEARGTWQPGEAGGTWQPAKANRIWQPEHENRGDRWMRARLLALTAALALGVASTTADAGATEWVNSSGTQGNLAPRLILEK